MLRLSPSSEAAQIARFSGSLVIARNRKCLPSGRNQGALCLSSPVAVSSLVTGVGRPLTPRPGRFLAMIRKGWCHHGSSFLPILPERIFRRLLDPSSGDLHFFQFPLGQVGKESYTPIVRRPERKKRIFSARQYASFRRIERAQTQPPRSILKNAHVRQTQADQAK